MKNSFLFGTALLCLLLLTACRDKQKDAADSIAAIKAEVMDTDREFSKYSELKGLRAAFTQYIDSNGILLRPGIVPLVEGNAMDFISQSDDSGFVMTWEPRSATLAASGDLAFTYGIYSLKENSSDSIEYGTYVTIWKKQPDGSWKFVLHSGNEGVE
ncbi:MAG TPA: hypothetical protein PKC39_09325 [Ferruginibacter sp.]|nr:hypothetical protein [Ferruginibacter sp.]HMP21147.1 hypothetical protein [Ferruginibacter sp.]